MDLTQAKRVLLIIATAREIIWLTKKFDYRFSPLVAVEKGTILRLIQKKPIRHIPGLKIARQSSSYFSTFRALNRHNSAILVCMLKLWPPFCSSWQANSKYVYINIP